MSSYGVGHGLNQGVQNVAQFLVPLIRQKMVNDQLQRGMSSKVMPYLVRGSAGGPGPGAGSASLSPAQTLVAGGRDPNSLTMDERMAGVTPDQLFDAGSPATLLTSSDLDDIRTTTAAEPSKGIPAYGSDEMLGHIAVGTAQTDFRKQAEDIGNSFIGSQKVYREAMQKFKAAEDARKIAIQKAMTQAGGNQSAVMTDPHVQATHKALREAQIDLDQAKQGFQQYAVELKRLLPNLKLDHLVDMGEIGQQVYQPNQTPAQFLTPGRNPAIR